MNKEHKIQSDSRGLTIFPAPRMSIIFSYL